MRGIISIVVLTLLFASCKSQFESVRTSNNPKEIYKAALKYYDNEEYVKAQSLFELSIPNYRGKEEAEDLFFKYAYTYFYNGEYILAAHYFNSFANTFFNSDRREEAFYMSSFSNYKMSPSPKLDQTYTQEAIKGFQTFINTYPRSERVAKANALIDEMRAKLERKAYLQGQLYYKVGQYEAAVQSFSNMLKDFPDSENADEIRFLMLKSSYILATNSVYSKKKERFERTIKIYEDLKEKFSKSKYSRDAKKYYTKSQKEHKKII